jgi:hypothetical protein
MDDAIAAYLRELETALRRAGRPTQPLVDEAAAHLLEDAARIAAAEGCDSAEAARRAVARFGSVGDILAAARKNAPMIAAAAARAATVVLAAPLIYDLWRLGVPDEHWIWWSFPAALALVSVVLWRALDGHRAPAWLTPVLVAQGALAAPMFLLDASTGVRVLPAHYHAVFSIHHVINVFSPFWLGMLVQAAAGLRALQVSRRGSTSAS